MNNPSLGTTSSPSAGEFFRGRLSGRTALVSGGAGDFGTGTVRALLGEGARVMIADLPQKREKCAGLLGENCAFCGCDVADETSAAHSVELCCKEFGGLDILVCAAGVTGAGGLDSLSTEDFIRIQKVNYFGYYYLVKYASAVMKKGFFADNERWSDIVQINSKSGLAGSKANFAYAGSKFGGVGLTKSFALELAPYNIKVNCVCPGNYYEGELWSEPENGLFTQFIKAGKVPGARNAAEVRDFYLSKQPLSHRGCLPEDVALAVIYCILQKFETGQAIRVTGGQL